jgi:uncharacterized protein YndB with AHSA1/START domain
VTGSKVIVAIRVPAGPALAFDVFTNEIAAWWQPNDLFQFTPRSPGVVRFEGGKGGRFVEELPGGKVFEIGKIKVWEPGARLVFDWRQATFTKQQNTEVEVRFEPVGSETRVTVEHRGWDSVSKEHVARHAMVDAVLLKHEGEWWQRMLAQLKARAIGRGH